MSNITLPIPFASTGPNVRYKRLLLTGAAGKLGRLLRPRLQSSCEQLLLSDLLSCGPLATHETEWPCDLADRAAMLRLLEGVDAVVHLGGVSIESPFEQVLASNISGCFNLYEAARLLGTKRIVFAGSHHTIGCYEQGTALRIGDKPRPDGYYGLSKLFAENMAQLYWDRYGIETVTLRLGSVEPEPIDRRALAVWLSLDDFERLIKAALTAQNIGCLTVFGMSANSSAWWSTEGWDRIGYVPQDNAEMWRSRVQNVTQPVGTPMDKLQGGRFLGCGPFEAKR